MPFWLIVAPRIFTKLANTVVKILLQRGIRVVAYLDDWLIWASAKEQCLKASKETLALLRSLGFCINKKKSRFIPKRVFD